MMIISKANIKLIYQHLLAEGVMVVKKDVRAPTHDSLPIPNLQVMKCLQSLRSRNIVTEEFNWQYHYYFLTDDGVKYLREYLHVGESVVPATHVNKPGSASGRREGERAERGERRAPRGDKEESGEYRRGGAWRRPEAQATA